MNDYLVNTLAYQKRARIVFGEMSLLISNVREQGPKNKALNAAFSELVSAMCLMAGPVDISERMRIKITGDHPTKNMVGSLEGNGNVRGFVDSDFEQNASLTDASRSIFGSRGTIVVTRDTGIFNGYTGVTELKYKSVAKNMEYYYTKSEQLPTYIQLFISKKDAQVARGVMLQLLPGEPKSIITDFNDLVRQKKEFFFNPQSTIDMASLQSSFFADLKHMSTKSLHYQCACTKELYYGIIFSLSPQEIDEIIQTKQVLNASCGMCGKEYSFTHSDIADLFGIHLQETSKRKMKKVIDR